MAAAGFSAPCPDLISPLLEAHEWRGPCGSWQAAARLAVLSKSWLAQIDAWRAFEIVVRLDKRADADAIKVVARCCANLQTLDLRGCEIKSLGVTLMVATKACTQLRELLLGRCTALPTALRVKDWAQHCPQLQEIDLSEWADLGDQPLHVLGESCPRLQRVDLSGCKRVSHSAVERLVKKLTGLVSLNLSDASKNDEPARDATTPLPAPCSTDSASRAVLAIGGCVAMQKLYLRGSTATAAVVVDVLTKCPQLVELDLSSCPNLTDAVVPAIARLPHLLRLCIADCPGISNAAITHAWPEVASRWAAGWGTLDWRGDPTYAGAETPGWFGPPPNARPIALRGSHSVVGRTRTADIRIGHNWPMPYISSRHMRLYHWLSWRRPPASPHLSPREKQPECEAWLVDLSQNGTFVNRKLIGVGKHMRLHDGDRIEVFNRELLRNRHDMSIPICFYKETNGTTHFVEDIDP